MTRISSFWFGLTLPLQALRLISRHPPLLFWSLLPLTLSLGFYSVLYFWLIPKVHGTFVLGLNHLLSGVGIGIQTGWLTFLVDLIIRILFLILAALTFSGVANILACPFNDFLAEETETRAHPPLVPVPPYSFRRRLRLLVLDMAKSGVATLLSFLTLFLTWIPVLSFVTFLMTALLFTFQFISYPQSRRGEGLREGGFFLLRHFYSSVGFGASLSILLMIPFIACFFLPLAVVGGTLLVARARGGTRLR